MYSFFPKTKLALKRACSRPLGERAQPKFLCRCSEQASFFDHHQRQRDDRDVWDWYGTERRDTLDIDDYRPEILNWVIKIPQLRESSALRAK